MSTTTSSHPQTQPRWFCHACQFRFNQPIDLQDPECTSCRSSFVEELEPYYRPDLPSLGLWARSSRSILTDPIQDDSPPIPSTRQRYEEQQQQQQNPQQNNDQQNPQIPFINFIDPLINILSAPAIQGSSDQHSPRSSSPHARPQNQPNPPSFSSIGEFFAQNYSPPIFTPSTSFSHRPTENNEDLDNNQAGTHADPNPSSGHRSPPQGIYTFAFGSQPSTSIPPALDPTRDRPTSHTPSENQPRQSQNDRFTNEEGFSFTTTGNLNQQPFTGILSLLQSAFGLNPGNSSNNATADNNQPTAASNNSSSPRTNDESVGDQTSTSSVTEGNPTDANEAQSTENSIPRHSRPTPRSPRVNVEESHPLRQFINILNSLTQSDGSISRNGVDGFVINGGAGFGFATQFNMDRNAPFGQSFGDYVASDSTMQDILNQLINMTGANGAHNPIPASESTIKSLKRFKFDVTSMGNEEPIECAICKDTFAADDGCMELPCKHFFHDEDCILPWLKQNGTCPVCRYSLVNNNENSESGPRTDGESSNREGDSERSRTRPEDEPPPIDPSHSNQTSSHDRPADPPESSHSSNWTDDWEVDQLEPQLDFD